MPNPTTGRDYSAFLASPLSGLRALELYCLEDPAGLKGTASSSAAASVSRKREMIIKLVTDCQLNLPENVLTVEISDFAQRLHLKRGEPVPIVT